MVSLRLHCLQRRYPFAKDILHLCSEEVSYKVAHMGTSSVAAPPPLLLNNTTLSLFLSEVDRARCIA
eukprot:3684170-Amphidinium_carterae.1